MRTCKNCQRECISIYCSTECNRAFKLKTKWVTSHCLTCGKEIISRISRPKQYCSVKCCSISDDVNKKRSESGKRTCLKRYGVSSPMKLKSTVDKMRRGFMKKYGVDWYSKTNSFVDSFKHTCLEKYGTEYPQQNEEIKNKTKESVKSNGGFTLESPILKEKVKSTMLKKYGTDNPLKCKEIKNKQQKTCLDRYGYITPLKNKKVKNLTKKTLMDKYGVINISHVPHIRHRVKETNILLFMNYLFNGDRLKNKVNPLFNKSEYISTDYNIKYPFQCNECNTKFEDHLFSGHVPRCPTCFPKHISILQREITDYIKSIISENDKILENTRSILPSGLELDVYIPTKKIAIEIDGLYWHGEISGNKNRKYHLSKTIECEQFGIRLIHIFENEWIYSNDILKRKLKHIFKNVTGISTIGARQCEIKEISSEDSSKFLNEHHIQGTDNSSIKLGAFYNDMLVSVMTFGKRRIALGRQKNIEPHEYELYRFAVGNMNVVGIGGKLLSYFKKVYNPIKIITYSDRRYSTLNSIYEKIGFRFIKSTQPTYWYYKIGTNKLYHRFNFRKSELSKKLPQFDPSLTEWENMQLNGYDRIWDCGHYKYEWVAP